MKNDVKVTENEMVGSRLKVWLALALKIHNKHVCWLGAVTDIQLIHPSRTLRVPWESSAMHTWIQLSKKAVQKLHRTTGLVTIAKLWINHPVKVNDGNTGCVLKLQSSKTDCAPSGKVKI